eukprot:259246_1
MSSNPGNNNPLPSWLSLLHTDTDTPPPDHIQLGTKKYTVPKEIENNMIRQVMGIKMDAAFKIVGWFLDVQITHFAGNGGRNSHQYHTVLARTDVVLDGWPKLSKTVTYTGKVFVTFFKEVAKVKSRNELERTVFYLGQQHRKWTEEKEKRKMLQEQQAREQIQRTNQVSAVNPQHQQIPYTGYPYPLPPYVVNAPYPMQMPHYAVHPYIEPNVSHAGAPRYSKSTVFESRPRSRLLNDADHKQTETEKKHTDDDSSKTMLKFYLLAQALLYLKVNGQGTAVKVCKTHGLSLSSPQISEAKRILKYFYDTGVKIYKKELTLSVSGWSKMYRADANREPKIIKLSEIKMKKKNNTA